jgi:4-diphosphocytidyl-2-C-methyl-D-erythritol kinase
VCEGDTVSRHDIEQGSEAAVAPATVVAPAKLTLSLRIVGQRFDGYHLLDAEMVSIDLVDEVTFRTGDGLEIVGEMPRGSLQQVPAGDDNLVRRALHAVGCRAHVRLVKRIPPGAGLGGGSSDGAAVLRWAGRRDDIDLAASLGADVPFCLRGGRARVRGIGDELEPLPYRPGTFTLLIPPLGCDTGAVYRAWDDLGGPTDEQGRNDLTPAALAVEARLATWRDRLRAATGQAPVLAGSGSTWYVEGAFPGDDRVVVHTLPPW